MTDRVKKSYLTTEKNRESGSVYGKEHFFDSIGLNVQDSLLTADKRARAFVKRYDDIYRSAHLMWNTRAGSTDGTDATINPTTPEFKSMEDFAKITNEKKKEWRYRCCCLQSSAR